MTFDQKLWLSNTSVSPGQVYNFHINLTNKKCTRVLSDRASAEFPNTHPYRHGMFGTRYNYLMANDRPGENIPYRDIVKVCRTQTYNGSKKYFSWYKNDTWSVMGKYCTRTYKVYWYIQLFILKLKALSHASIFPAKILVAGCTRLWRHSLHTYHMT